MRMSDLAWHLHDNRFRHPSDAASRRDAEKCGIDGSTRG